MNKGGGLAAATGGTSCVGVSLVGTLKNGRRGGHTKRRGRGFAMVGTEL